MFFTGQYYYCSNCSKKKSNTAGNNNNNNAILPVPEFIWMTTGISQRIAKTSCFNIGYISQSLSKY